MHRAAQKREFTYTTPCLDCFTSETIERIPHQHVLLFSPIISWRKDATQSSSTSSKERGATLYQHKVGFCLAPSRGELDVPYDTTHDMSYRSLSALSWIEVHPVRCTLRTLMHLTSGMQRLCTILFYISTLWQCHSILHIGTRRQSCCVAIIHVSHQDNQQEN